MSRPTILTPRKLEGREMHLLSQPETAAALLALYNPDVFDIHEQRVLDTTPCAHPLAEHPLAMGLDLKPMRGTVEVADSLGVLGHHPKLFAKVDEATAGTWVPFPYIGDLLLYLRDEAGPYCVNWTVKNELSAFQRRGPQLLHRPHDDSPDLGAIARHRIEAQYYEDAAIRTVQVTEDAIDRHLRYNLAQLFGWHRRPINASGDVRIQLLRFFESHVGGTTVVNDLVICAQREHGLSRDDVLAVLNQDIWNRELSVDLFKPYLIDRPLRSPVQDPLDRYADWFSR